MLVPAAQYVRMSTDKQDFSIGLQCDVIARYATENGYEVVRTYADEGISGLTMDKRPALKRMMKDVLSGNLDFEIILINDISRLGRFQNPDEAAHYEFLCQEAGVGIRYCSEPFLNDGSLAATLLKSIKRAMAAEYSRELSSKVAHAQETLSERGFWQGGPAGYGLRRQLILPDGSYGRLMESGDRKGPHGGRTVLVHGPADEVATVRRIYNLCLGKGLGARSIARLLNNEGIPGPNGFWLVHQIHDILGNEKYAGTNVLRKTHRRLGAKAIRRAQSTWIRTPGAFAPIVDIQDFHAVQARRHRTRTQFDDAQLTEGLRQLYQQHGAISLELLRRSPDAPPVSAYFARYGSLLDAYQHAGLPITWRHVLGAKTLRTNRASNRKLHLERERDPVALLGLVKGVMRKYGRLSKDLIEEELGYGMFSVVVAKFGSARRLYALAGYQPTKQQERRLAREPEVSPSRIGGVRATKAPSN